MSSGPCDVTDPRSTRCRLTLSVVAHYLLSFLAFRQPPFTFLLSELNLCMGFFDYAEAFVWLVLRRTVQGWSLHL